MGNKYRIMVVKSQRDNGESLYQYLKDTDNADHELRVYEADTIEQIDRKVENMLDEGDYSKSDFIVIQVVNYKVKADLFDN